MGTRIVLEANGSSLVAWEEHPGGSCERVAWYRRGGRRWNRFRPNALGRRRLALAILQLYFGGFFANYYGNLFYLSLLAESKPGDSFTEEQVYEWAVAKFFALWSMEDEPGGDVPDAPEHLDPRSYPWCETPPKNSKAPKGRFIRIQETAHPPPTEAVQLDILTRTRE